MTTNRTITHILTPKKSTEQKSSCEKPTRVKRSMRKMVLLDSLCFLSQTNSSVSGFSPNPKADFASQSGFQVFVKKTLSDLEGAEKCSLWLFLVSVSSTYKSPKTNNLKQQVTHRFGRRCSFSMG